MKSFDFVSLCRQIQWLFAVVLFSVIPLRAFSDEVKHYPAPKQVVDVQDAKGNIQIGKTIYGDRFGKPALDQPIAEFGPNDDFFDPQGNAIHCTYDCVERYGSTFDAGQKLYVLLLATVQGQRYAQIHFLSKPAWILVPHGVDFLEITPDETQCYVQRKREKDPDNKKEVEVLNLRVGVPMTIKEQLSTTRGRITKRMRLEESGIVTFSLPDTSEDYKLYISQGPFSDNPIEENYGYSEILTTKEPSQLLLAAGLYVLNVEFSGGDGDSEIPCPASTATVHIVESPLPAQLTTFSRDVASQSQELLSITAKPQRVKLLLTRAFYDTSFKASLKGISLVRIEDIQRPSDFSDAQIQVQYGDGDGRAVDGLSEQFVASAGEFTIRVSKEDSMNLHPTAALPVSFLVSIVEGSQGEEKLFDLTWAKGVSIPDSALEFRNVSGINLHDVHLSFDYVYADGRYRGNKEVSSWPKGEVQEFHFSGPFSGNSGGIGFLKLEVTSVNGTSDIAFSLKNPKFPLAEPIPRYVESPEYEQQIKLRVFRYCTETNPQLGESFSKCQDRWLREEDICRRQVDPRTGAFIDCVRERLKQNFPELLPHLGEDLRKK